MAHIKELSVIHEAEYPKLLFRVVGELEGVLLIESTDPAPLCDHEDYWRTVEAIAGPIVIVEEGGSILGGGTAEGLAEYIDNHSIYLSSNPNRASAHSDTKRQNDSGQRRQARLGGIPRKDLLSPVTVVNPDTGENTQVPLIQFLTNTQHQTPTGHWFETKYTHVHAQKSADGKSFIRNITVPIPGIEGAIRMGEEARKQKKPPIPGTTKERVYQRAKGPDGFLYDELNGRKIELGFPAEYCHLNHAIGPGYNDDANIAYVSITTHYDYHLQYVNNSELIGLTEEQNNFAVCAIYYRMPHWLRDFVAAPDNFIDPIEARRYYQELRFKGYWTSEKTRRLVDLCLWLGQMPEGMAEYCGSHLQTLFDEYKQRYDRQLREFLMVGVAPAVLGMALPAHSLAAAGD